jgi:tRNA nucleotidyltransferase (CCA-adding enzyme)
VKVSFVFSRLDISLKVTVADELLAEWQVFIDHLESMEIMDAPNEKPIMTGTQLSKELGGVQPGIWMKPALDVVMAWQLRNPGKKGEWAEAVEEVRRRSVELKIPQ